MKVRFRFTKEGELCYIGHLDMMRYFQKAIRRAHIDIAYSQGFNPHQILSFASPLGLGMTSEGEYFDADIKTCEDPSELTARLNEVLSEGVRVTGACLIPDEGRFNAMAMLTACRYRLDFSGASFYGPDLQGLWDKYMAQAAIRVTKETKTSTAEIDIKPLIHESVWRGSSLELLLSAGSDETVKATLVLGSFLKFAGIDLTGEEAFRKGQVRICRIDQYATIDGSYVSLGRVGEAL